MAFPSINDYEAMTIDSTIDNALNFADGAMMPFGSIRRDAPALGKDVKVGIERVAGEAVPTIVLNHGSEVNSLTLARDEKSIRSFALSMSYTENTYLSEGEESDFSKMDFNLQRIIYNQAASLAYHGSIDAKASDKKVLQVSNSLYGIASEDGLLVDAGIDFSVATRKEIQDYVALQINMMYRKSGSRPTAIIMSSYLPSVIDRSSSIGNDQTWDAFLAKEGITQYTTDMLDNTPKGFQRATLSIGYALCNIKAEDLKLYMGSRPTARIYGKSRDEELERSFKTAGFLPEKTGVVTYVQDAYPGVDSPAAIAAAEAKARAKAAAEAK